MNEQYCKVQEDQESGVEEKCLFQGNKSDEQAHTTQMLGKRNSQQGDLRCQYAVQ